MCIIVSFNDLLTDRFPLWELTDIFFFFLMKVKRKTNQLCTSTWMQRTSLFPGSSLLSLPTTWRDMWFNTNNLEVTWVTLLIGPNWTKAKQQHFSEVCSWCFYRGTQCSVDFRHMLNWILRIDCVNSLLNDLKKTTTITSDPCLHQQDSLKTTQPTKYHCSLCPTAMKSVTFHQHWDTLCKKVCVYVWGCFRVKDEFLTLYSSSQLFSAL